MLTKSIAMSVRTAGFTRLDVSNTIEDFITHADIVNKYPAFTHDLEAFFEERAARRCLDQARVTKSIVIEHVRLPAIFRCIVFETDYNGTTSVLDIAESDGLNNLKKWLRKNHDGITHVRIDNFNKEVTDPWNTALCLMRPCDPENV